MIDSRLVFQLGYCVGEAWGFAEFCVLIPDSGADPSAISTASSSWPLDGADGWQLQVARQN